MADVQAVVELGRRLRADNDLKVRQPLAALRVAGVEFEEGELSDLILDELNVKRVDRISDETELCDISYKANFKTLGRKCGSKMKAVAAAIAGIGSSGGKVSWPMTIEGVEVALEDVAVTRTPKAGLVVASEGKVVVGLETALTPELVAEGDAREFVSRVQAMRKAADFDVTQRIAIAVASDDVLAAALGAHMEHIKNETLALEVSVVPGSGEVDINGHMAAIDVKAV